MAKLLYLIINTYLTSLLSKKSGRKPRILRRKVFGSGHKSPLQKRPTASCLRYLSLPLPVPLILLSDRQSATNRESLLIAKGQEMTELVI